MIVKKEMIAMLLAGGQGSRLGIRQTGGILWREVQDH